MTREGVDTDQEFQFMFTSHNRIGRFTEPLCLAT